MKVINIRSPYFISVDEAGQIGSKVELYIWNDDTSEPATPTYTRTKKVASLSKVRNDYNISNFVKEYIDNTITYISSIDLNDPNNWAHVKVNRYKETTTDTFELLDTEYFIALNGYTLYINGYNTFSTNPVLNT